MHVREVNFRFRFDMLSEQRQLRSVGKLRRGRSRRAAAAAASVLDEVCSVPLTGRHWTLCKF